ncbi:Glutamate--tRNA ligase [Meiothermus luteus]|jgi:glutamyl-tRNA synthetase|uniref:Glutamate--tRNA ligase n=1 Tax=Meiothermus luteus TaxID=2026184 RepID=A0A399F227_9DEIN|nr:glutamate--tRNA ligase [Meiothermus luteus]RIH89756.1 Glutamate--tRNA ligase [Meiothermus luteus]RMH57797.1 MAG: glutamate--tRNA ligase [Deinococcota bacterium]
MVVTRIAPSPTGDPHVGTAYQALFNYVFAKQHGGKFIVRIEDTDRSRYNPTSERRILEMLEWLGLSPDESPLKGGPNGPYVQSQRLPIYHQHVQMLLAKGAAYRAFDTPEELAKAREEALRAGKQEMGYNRRYRDYPPEEAERRAAAGEPHVVRLKVPLEGKTIVHDLLRGPVEFDNATLDDKVILKADGYPTYHLAAMVDDHLMGVTHVIRAEEWLTSTPFHIHILRAFGWKEPVWCHTPLLRNPDKSKLSKRKMDTSVDSYRAQGILPEALLNYLGTMAWSMPDGREIFSLEEMMAHFRLERIRLGAPVFDLEKLRWMNGKYIREVLSLEDLTERVKPFLERAGLTYPSEDYLKRVVEAMRARFETLQEFVDKSMYFFSEAYPMQEKALAKLREGAPFLPELHERLQKAPDTLPETTEPLLRGYAEAKGVKAAQVMQPLRAALTGSLETPGMFELLDILGKERVLRRLERAMERIKAL